MKKFRLLVLAFAAMLAGTQNGVAQDWTGSTPAELKSAASEGINSESEDANFYLYNVGTGKFLTVGGNWGTQAVLKDVGLLLTLDKPIDGTNNNGSDVAYSIHTKYSVSTVSKNYVQLMDGSSSTSEHDEGIWYTDRLYNFDNPAAGDNQIKDDVSKDLATFYFHSIGDNKYNIYVRSDHEGKTVWGQVIEPSHLYDRSRVYLVAPQNAANNDPVGIEKTNYYNAYQESDVNAQWMLISLREVRENFRSELANADKASPADGSYVIKCQNFSRNNGDLHEWRVGNLTDNQKLSTDYDGGIFSEKQNRMLRPGDEIFLNSGNGGSTQTSYYIGNGYGVGDDSSEGYYDNSSEEMDASKHESHQKLYGGYWTANIHGPGTIWQQIYVPITNRGWYLVSCDGFTTATQGRVYLFAATTTTKIPDNGGVTIDYKDYKLGDFNLNTPAPATYTAAGQMLMSEDGYQKNLMIYIDPADDKYNGQEVYLIMGVQATGEPGTAGEYNAVNSDAWTCIDNFEIKYAGNQEEFIILDENQRDITYINNQIDKTHSYPMRLGRTLEKDKWNSLILPVTLTAQQLTLAFGDNVKLSEKSRDTQKNDYVIEFKSVDLNVDPKKEVLMAGVPYIIKPSIEPREEAGTYETRGADPIDIPLGKHYLINQVTLNCDEITDATVTSQKYDCGIAKTMYFKGTYTQQDNLIPDGSYLLSGGQWYYMDLNGGKVTSVKGFRTWLEPEGDTAGKNMQFSVDGVIDGGATNAIEGIVGDSQTKTDNKVYNMNGQVVRNNSASLEGLPKGVYIVNNKKYIVK